MLTPKELREISDKVHHEKVEVEKLAAQKAKEESRLYIEKKYTSALNDVPELLKAAAKAGMTKTRVYSYSQDGYFARPENRIVGYKLQETLTTQGYTANWSAYKFQGSDDSQEEQRYELIVEW